MVLTKIGQARIERSIKRARKLDLRRGDTFESRTFGRGKRGIRFKRVRSDGVIVGEIFLQPEEVKDT